MTRRVWITLPLAAALMVPAVAQQTSSNSATQTAPATSQAPAGADQNVSAHQPLQAETREGFWGKLNPMARKKYVQRQMQPVRDRVNELDELTASNSKQIKDVDTRAQEGIRQAMAKADQADQNAVQAGTRAQQAHQTATQANTRLVTVEQVVGNIDQYQPVTQADIRFRAGQSVLSKKAKEALDQMAESVQGQKGYIVEVQGFSAGRGQAALENSQRMAQSVVRYLVLNHEIPVYRIYLLGMGNAPVQATNAGAKARRTTTGGRVEVSLLKNGVEQLTAGNTSVAPASEGGMTGTSVQPAPQPTPQSSTGPNANASQPAYNLNAPAIPSQPQQQQ